MMLKRERKVETHYRGHTSMLKIERRTWFDWYVEKNDKRINEPNIFAFIPEIRRYTRYSISIRYSAYFSLVRVYN